MRQSLVRNWWTSSEFFKNLNFTIVFRPRPSVVRDRAERCAQYDGLQGTQGAHHMRSRITLLITLVILLLGGFAAMAQETTGTVRGRIVDAQGLAVPGVTV